MNDKKRTHRLFSASLMGIVLALLAVGVALAAGNISNTDKWAWGANVGWINFNPDNGGVTVYPDHLEGYAWGENVGWIRLGTYTGGGSHTYVNSAPDNYGVNNDGVGHLSGYAWGASVGWINFDPDGAEQVTIDPATGDFNGYAWGENVGWIHFRNASPAYKVKTTFVAALNGQQAIAGTGLTHLLGQTAYVDVSSVGSPPLISLTLHGYLNTLPPNASSFLGFGAGTNILDRYFWLEPNSDAAGYTLTLCLNYDDSEVTGAGASEADLQLCRWTGSAWACQPRAASSSTSANLVCADNVTAFSNWAIASGSPLAVTLASFDAQGQADRVVVTWETVSEINNAGFNLYRGLHADGSDRALLATVPSQTPGSTQGAAYSYEDAAVEAGQTYWYWLEDMDLSGATTLHGPVSATMQAPTAVTLAGFEAAPGGKASVAGLALATGLAVLLAGWLSQQRRRRTLR